MGGTSNAQLRGCMPRLWYVCIRQTVEAMDVGILTRAFSGFNSPSRQQGKLASHLGLAEGAAANVPVGRSVKIVFSTIRFIDSRDLYTSRGSPFGYAPRYVPCSFLLGRGQAPGPKIFP